MLFKDTYNSNNKCWSSDSSFSTFSTVEDMFASNFPDAPSVCWKKSIYRSARAILSVCVVWNLCKNKTKTKRWFW